MALTKFKSKVIDNKRITCTEVVIIIFPIVYYYMYCMNFISHVIFIFSFKAKNMKINVYIYDKSKNFTE